MDDNLRSCRAQAWLWNNRTAPDVASRLDELASEFIDGPPAPHSPLWIEFANIELGMIRAAWADVYAQVLGAASDPRPIGLDLELVLMVPTRGQYCDSINQPSSTTPCRSWCDASVPGGSLRPGATSSLSRAGHRTS